MTIYSPTPSFTLIIHWNCLYDDLGEAYRVQLNVYKKIFIHSRATSVDEG